MVRSPYRMGLTTRRWVFDYAPVTACYPVCQLVEVPLELMVPPVSVNPQAHILTNELFRCGWIALTLCALIRKCRSVRNEIVQLRQFISFKEDRAFISYEHEQTLTALARFMRVCVSRGQTVDLLSC